MHTPPLQLYYPVEVVAEPLPVRSPSYQYRGLFWGVVGAQFMRAIFILMGAQLLERFHWMIYVFGVFLIYAGIRMARHRDDREVHPERNPILKLARRALPVTSDYLGQKFVVREGGRHVRGLDFELLRHPGS